MADPLTPEEMGDLSVLYGRASSEQRRLIGAAHEERGLDVERLARAMEDVFPGWLDEAPGTAEAQAEMREYARRLGEAYAFLWDSASAGLATPEAAPERTEPAKETL